MRRQRSTKSMGFKGVTLVTESCRGRLTPGPMRAARQGLRPYVWDVTLFSPITEPATLFETTGFYSQGVSLR